MSDRDFWKFFSGLAVTLVGVTVVLFVIANAIGAKPATSGATMDAKAIAERIKPVGEVTVASGSHVVNAVIPTANAAGADKGKATYDTTCAVCHGAGIAGAPKLGDKVAWKDRIAKGDDALYNNALKGFQGKAGMMPPKGGNVALKDDEVKAAVDYMVTKAK
jgi:cytochrome c5